MDVKDLENLAGGRLYSGRMAKQVKLVDELGTLDDAVADAKRLAGLKDEDKIERLNLPKPKTFLEQLLGGSIAEAPVKSLATDITQYVEMAQTLRHLFSEPTVLLMPCSVQVKYENHYPLRQLPDADKNLLASLCRLLRFVGCRAANKHAVDALAVHIDNFHAQPMPIGRVAHVWDAPEFVQH